MSFNDESEFVTYSLKPKYEFKKERKYVNNGPECFSALQETKLRKKQISPPRIYAAIILQLTSWIWNYLTFTQPNHKSENINVTFFHDVTTNALIYVLLHEHCLIKVFGYFPVFCHFDLSRSIISSQLTNNLSWPDSLFN